jgi:hypothetical protein
MAVSNTCLRAVVYPWQRPSFFMVSARLSAPPLFHKERIMYFGRISVGPVGFVNPRTIDFNID